VAVTVKREDSSVSLTGERVRVRIDLAPLRLSLSDERGEIGVFGATVGALVDGKAQPMGEPSGARVTANLVRDVAFEDDVETPLGRASRVRLRAALSDGLEVSLAVELGGDWPGAIFALELRNTGPRARDVAALEPFAWAPGAGARLALPAEPRELLCLALGHQSWSPARWLRLGERPPSPRRVVRRVYASPFAPRPKRGRFVSESATALGQPGRPGLVLGFTSHSRFLSWFEVANEPGRLHAVSARSATDGESLAPGAALAAERLWLGIAAPVEGALAQWAERAGREMGAPVPAKSLAGWCSWYRFGTRVQADDVRRNVRALTGLGAPLDVVQIDDGFQSAIGDWLSPAPGFPDGLAPLAREIRAAGFRPGLWLAPFLAAPRSRLAQTRPEWLLKDARGKPVTALWNPDWPGGRCFALDASHPEVEAWLESLGREVRALGFDYLKLDFLFAGALGGARHEPRTTAVQAYRRGVAALRRGAGPGTFLLGCGAALGASIGLFEAMRIGPDVAARWTNPTFDRIVGVSSGASARNSLANVFVRAPLHQRLWLNDPDCVLLREEPTKLSDTEVRTLAAAVALSGGLVVVSDEIADLAGERLDWLVRMLPSVGHSPETGAARASGLPEELVTRFPDGSALWLRVNFGEKPERLDLDLRALGLRGPTRVWDVFAHRELERASGELALGMLEPHAARLLRLTPDDSGARVIGSTLHFASGAFEVESLAADEAGARLKLRLAGRRSGEIALALPSAPRPVRAHVAFEDSLDLRVGLVNRGGISDR